ncbi:MAG: choice-of-anchor D domain-containing protein, partial [Myxococcota bacterium]
VTEAVSLTGNGTRPDIDVIPGDVEFGEVTIGCCSQEERVAIYNSGDGTLSINELNILASSDSGFSVTQPPTDTELGPGESTELFVRYCAGNANAASGVLEIQSSDDNEEFFTVALAAQGTTSSDGFDTYTQPERPTVDVLWVVDDSASMGDEQDDLANNFDSFISTAISLDTDYHLGVISTEVESEFAGQLYHCNDANRFIKESQPTSQQEAQFRCWVKTSDYDRPNSDTKEAPLQAARLALDFPNVEQYNDGFLREEATLFVILVTDEEDQSDGTPDLYVDFFRNLKGVGNADLLNISAISGPPPDGCGSATSNQFDFDAVDAVGGEFRSICTSDWSDLITDLGLDVFNARRQFPLDRPATASTLQVRVCDGTSCTNVSQDPTNGWSFEPETNAVVFNGSAVPGPGETIEVQYVAICF